MGSTNRTTSPHNPEAARTRSKGAIAKRMDNVKEVMISAYAAKGCYCLSVADFVDEVYEEIEGMKTRAQAEAAVKEVLHSDPGFELAGGVDESLSELWEYKHLVKIK